MYEYLLCSLKDQGISQIDLSLKKEKSKGIIFSLTATGASVQWSGSSDPEEMEYRLYHRFKPETV